MTGFSYASIAARVLQLDTITLYLSGIAILVTFKFIIVASYNLFLHPLRRYPGPKLAAATNLIWSYNIIRGDEVAWVRRCHDKYGEVVRLGPDRLSYINPQAWKDIYGHSTGRPEHPKDPRFSKELDPKSAASLLTIADASAHSRVRKVFANAFSDRALKLQESLISGHVTKLMRNITDTISKNSDTRLDFVKLYNCATFDIMGDLTFGESLGMLDTGEYTPWVKAVFGGIKYASHCRISREYPWVGSIVDALTALWSRDLFLAHFQHSVDRVNRRLEKNNDTTRPDIWKLVLEKGKDLLTLQETHINASLFMLAGTETTATLLSGLTFLLLKNPIKMRKLVEEVRALSAEQLKFDVLQRLPFLNACIEEGLRIYPPFPIGMPRIVANGGNTILGECLPEGTRVTVAHHAAYLSPLNFKDADVFEPERWLSNTAYKNDRKDVLQPFSYGPRNCLGKKFAYYEMQSLLANVLWHFDLELCSESETWLDQKVYIAWEKPELWIKAKQV